MGVKSIKKYLRIDRKEIAFFKFILEAYDGLAGLSTVDSFLGVVVLNIPPGRESETETLINALAGEMLIEPVDDVVAELR